jgi:hypothetical protein
VFVIVVATAPIALFLVVTRVVHPNAPAYAMIMGGDIIVAQYLATLKNHQNL